MVSDIFGDKMERKTKKEQKKKKKRDKIMSSPDVVVSAAAPVDGAKSSSSSFSWKPKFPSLRRAFRRMLSLILPCVSSSEVDESIETQSTSLDTHTDASSSPAVSGSSDPELDLQPAIHEEEAIRDVAEEQSSASCPEETSTSTSTDSRTSDLLDASLEMEVIGESSTSNSADGSYSSAESKPSDLETSAVGVSSSEESETDLLAELQAAAVLEDAAGDQAVSNVDLDCVLGVLASMTVQSNGLSQTEILQLIQGSSQREQIEQQSSRSDTEDDVEPADVSTALPAKIKHLGFPNLGNTCYMNSVLQCLLTTSPFRDDVLSQREQWNEGSTMLRALTDLHMTRLTGNDKKLKAKLLSKVKACIETRHPDFWGDHQQDAHEFLMVCLSHLKEEGELLQSYWPKYTCPVANMEFQLNRLRTCDSCGIQKTFREDCNYLSLVISPRGCLIDSLQQYFKTSSLDCLCSECAGTTASEALELITFPRVLVLLVMRFDIRSSMRKVKDRLEVPGEFSLSCSTGHYISHIRDITGSGWLECNDTSITRTSWAKASNNFGKNGYMLFYVKR
ncbi:hypothetical protein ABG768_003955 [Culter alburnus]|uniref:USP domain-containing protein n=1 Tax=Culter alburnus TaxID=194366 RepID=A0AAW2A1C2_CULAL